MSQQFNVSWNSPSNIALVKYWGKHGRQLPSNPSISLTLKHAKTHYRITAIPSDKFVITSFKFDGVENQIFLNRVEKYINAIKDELPFLNELSLAIETSNDFPHSVGIASSASSFSALSLCLCELEEKVLGKPTTGFFQKASYFARLGSGSASRSIYSPFAIWGVLNDYGTSDKYAVRFDQVDDKFKSLKNAIVIVDGNEKAVSSSLGHSLMNDNPYAGIRFDLARKNTIDLIKAMQDCDLSTFINIVENEALGLHALMMLSNPSFVLLKPKSIDIIQKVRQFRVENDIPVCFTIDAGPNIHILYFQENANDVESFIKQNFSDTQLIFDEIGDGPINNLKV